MISRRNFLINSGITAAGAMLSADVFAGGTFKKNKLGLQLYSLRDEIGPSGLDGVLKKVAAAG